MVDISLESHLHMCLINVVYEVEALIQIFLYILQSKSIASPVVI